MEVPAPLTYCAARVGLMPVNLRRSGVDEQRIGAILLGRWTPSPEERDAIAAVFGLTRADIVWGHTIPVQHLYGQGPA